jgi:hypothetical protein
VNKRDAARSRIIISELTKMSRNGWRDARPSDYRPLEAELHKLNEKERKRRSKR